MRWSSQPEEHSFWSHIKQCTTTETINKQNAMAGLLQMKKTTLKSEEKSRPQPPTLQNTNPTCHPQPLQTHKTILLVLLPNFDHTCITKLNHTCTRKIIHISYHTCHTALIGINFSTTKETHQIHYQNNLITTTLKKKKKKKKKNS